MLNSGLRGGFSSMSFVTYSRPDCPTTDGLEAIPLRPGCRTASCRQLVHLCSRMGGQIRDLSYLVVARDWLIYI